MAKKVGVAGDQLGLKGCLEYNGVLIVVLQCVCSDTQSQYSVIIIFLLYKACISAVELPPCLLSLPRCHIYCMVEKVRESSGPMEPRQCSKVWEWSAGVDTWYGYYSTMSGIGVSAYRQKRNLTVCRLIVNIVEK